jgi:3-dehydroquinate dehydratase type I
MIARIVTPQVFDDITSGSLKAASMCDFLELRYDLFKGRPWASLAGMLKEAMPDKKVIGTIRTRSDGGEFQQCKPDMRLSLWKTLLDAETTPDWVDIELNSIDTPHLHLFREREVKVLLSAHDWSQKYPTQTAVKLMGKGAEYNVDGIKLATTGSGSIAKVYEFLKFTECYKLVSAFVMGSNFSFTRIHSLEKGANLAYASLDGSRQFGILPVEETASALKKSPK